MSESRLLTLTGVGGVGKTRLALRLAGEVARAFSDGVWLVDLAALRDEELLVSTVAAALGLGERATRAPVDQLADYLADKHLLMVLDNCEHMIDGCAALARRLLKEAPRLRIMATSRQPLGIEGEAILTVPPLPVPETPLAATVSESVQLFAERAAAVVPDFAVTEETGDVVAGICRRLDGIPLAIELAAVRVRALPVAGILERLDHRFGLLAQRSRAALPRHQTLRAAIEWSYDMCSDRERILWGRMSVFVGSCDLEAIEQVCSGGEIASEEVFDLVAELVDKSIIFRQDDGSRTRYRLLETIREFGGDLLSSSGEQTQMRARHWEYYRNFVRSADTEWFGPHQVDWLVRLRAEQPNLRTALEYALTEPDATQGGLEMAAALYLFWAIAGSLREGSRLLKRVLQANKNATSARAKAMNGYTYLLVMLGNVDEALTIQQESRALGERLNDASACAYSALWTGAAKMYLGDVSTAFRLMEEALAAHRSLGDPLGTCADLHHLSILATAVEDPRAREFGEECLAVCVAHGAELSKSWALWVIGLEHIKCGEFALGKARVSEALRIRVPVGDLTGEAYCVEALAWAAVIADDMKRAARLFGAAHTIWRRVGSQLVESGYLQQFHSPFETRARQALGDDAYMTHFAMGQQLDIDNAISYALEETKTRPVAAPAGESVLTPREREIAELVGRGLSNKEIAATLVIAQRTAEGHVENILSKLGFKSRTQIAAWITDNPPPESADQTSMNPLTRIPPGRHSEI